MRTTIEISDDTLRKLRSTQPGEGRRATRGLSRRRWRRTLASRIDESADERWNRLESLEGAWGDEEAERVRKRIRETRKLWR
jgi:hypothetical protein